MTNGPLLSVVLATYNRADALRETLGNLRGLGLASSALEIIVVDNGSGNDSIQAIAREFDARLLPLKKNRGSCAKAVGVRFAGAPLLLFLDDDSFPRPGCIERMLACFEHDPRLGAAGFTVHLPDGRQECSALSDVFVGCGVGLRAAALRAVGGLDASFFMQAEEYDLAFRLANAGWECRIYDDLQVEHRKTPHARYTDRLPFYDTRNNLRLVNRYLDGEARVAYRQDWLQRYGWLAESAGQQVSFENGVSAAGRLAAAERTRFRSQRLKAVTFEKYFRWERIGAQMQALRRSGVRNVSLVDLGKNVYAFYRAAAQAGLAIDAVLDDRFAAPGRLYRGVPVIRVAHGLAHEPAACVIANTSYVHAQYRAADLKRRGVRNVYAWFTTAGPASGAVHIPAPAVALPASEEINSGSLPANPLQSASARI